MHLFKFTTFTRAWQSWWCFLAHDNLLVFERSGQSMMKLWLLQHASGGRELCLEHFSLFHLSVVMSVLLCVIPACYNWQCNRNWKTFSTFPKDIFRYFTCIKFYFLCTNLLLQINKITPHKQAHHILISYQFYLTNHHRCCDAVEMQDRCVGEVADIVAVMSFLTEAQE